MNARTRHLVVERAQSHCEYCRIHQRADLFRFHVEHVIARQHTGSDELSNLALACHHCNAHKGTNLSAIDADSGLVVRLYNPRIDSWVQHFRLDGTRIVGQTPIGRATVRLLEMNDRDRVELRGLSG